MTYSPEPKFSSFLRQDWVFRFLFLNALFVILGYALAVATGLASVGIAKVLRLILLLVSLAAIFFQNDWKFALKATKYSHLIISLCLILPGFALVAKNVLFSMNFFVLHFYLNWFMCTNSSVEGRHILLQQQTTWDQDSRRALLPPRDSLDGVRCLMSISPLFFTTPILSQLGDMNWFFVRKSTHTPVTHQPLLIENRQ